MPNSRSRHSRNRSDPARRRARAARYHESRREAATASIDEIVARFGETDWNNLQACADAEARGDVQGALTLYSRVSLAEESIHRGRLEMLAELGDEAPGWLISRWLTLQVRRPLWSDPEESAHGDQTLLRLLRTAYPHGFDNDRMEGMSLDLFISFLHERDWMLRQLVVYEEGGLREFVRTRAGSSLLARADHVADWVETPMGGYRLESDEGGCLQVTDLGTGEVLNVLDLGLAFQHWPGQHFLARIVPTVTDPGLMFEWRPLPVDSDTAELVAADPGRWVEILAERALSGELPRMFSLLDDDTDLVSDLPAHSWLALLELHQIADLPQIDGVISFDDVALIVLDRLLRAASAAGPAIAAARHVTWTLVLHPGVDEAVRNHFTQPHHGHAWRVLAGIVAEPARGRCRRYAEISEAPAA